MNAKVLFKTVFMLVMLFLLVLIGMNNPERVTFALPPILPSAVHQPAAIMYFACFALGLLAGVVLTGGKKGGSSGSSKPAKSDK